MPGMMPEERTRRVWSLANTGYNTAEISEITGLSKHTVANMVLRGRKRGVVKERERKPLTVKHLMRRNEVKLGNISMVFDDLTPEQGAWVMDQVVKYDCRTAAEFIVELIRDAHAEATNDK
jgi:DNA-binding transcriptional regulator LsrR (DeoR family)